MKSLKIFLFLGVGILLFLGAQAWADVPRLINFQGRLTDGSGTPVKDSTYSVLFTIYDVPVGGANLWSETQSVATKGGTFNVNLGSATALPDNIFDDTTRYLAMKVGTDPEMTPRQRMVSMGYGYRVRTVDGATGGVISGNVDIQSDLTVSGNVGIGTASPLSQLHLESSNPISEGIRIYNTSATGDPAISFLTDGVFQYTLGVDNDDGDKFQISAGSSLNSSERLTLTSTGNVGIGTTAPSEMLEIFRDNADALIRFHDFGDAEFKVGLDVTGATRRFRIAPTPSNADPGSVSTGLAMDYSSGNVGIGTSPSSLYRLHVYKSGQNSALLEISNPGFGEVLGLKNADSTGDAAINFYSGQSYIGNMGLIRTSLPKRFFILSNNPSNLNLTLVEAGGNVGIGTTSPGNILSVVQNSSTDPIADAWTTYSSADYKEGIRELSDQEYSEALTKLLETPVVKFRYKGQTEQDKEKIGIVIEEAPAEIVSEGNPKAASLSEYISLLHAGLKAQQAEIQALKETVRILQERNGDVK